MQSKLSLVYADENWNPIRKEIMNEFFWGKVNHKKEYDLSKILQF